MRRRLSFFTVAFTVTGLAGLSIGCSGSGGSGITATPTAAPSATPSPSPTPTIASLYNTMGNISCTAADEAIPGTYVNIVTNGTVVGSTYTGDGSGFNGYQMIEYGPPGATPAPTTPPLTPATPAPSATPGALGIIYYGEYTVPAFTDAGTGTPIDATGGCFEFETTQALGGTVGEARPDAAATPSAQGYGLGEPAFAAPYPNQTGYVSEPGTGGAGAYGFNTITITNLTRTTGSGTFTFVINGSMTTVTGAVTITGSTTYPSEPIEDALKHHPQMRRR